MNIISWNVKGLGRPEKRFLLKDFLALHHAEVCCLQESKLEAISPIVWKEIGGSKLDQFVLALHHADCWVEWCHSHGKVRKGGGF